MVSDALKDPSKCISAGRSDEQIVDQLRVVKNSQQIYHQLEGHGVSVSINYKDGKFFRTDPYQAIRDRSFKSDVNMLMGFTSFEGSLEKDSYPHKFNKGNFMSAYQEWPNDLYNEATRLSGDKIELLACRELL